MSNAQVGCIIPTYQNRQLLMKHLPAVLDSLRKGDLLTIIEDAGSDDTVEFLKSKYKLESVDLKSDKIVQSKLGIDINAIHAFYPGSIEYDKGKLNVQVFQTTTNVRFGQVVNLAARLTETPYIFICNNDVSPASDTISVLVEQMRADKNIFAAGCLEYSSNKKNDPSGKNELWFERGLFQHRRAAEQTDGETAWVSGGSGLFDRKKWLKLGGFDTQFYPAYWEDIDLSYRAKKANWRVMFTAQTYVLHQHESTHKSIFGDIEMLRISWKNGRYFTWKHSSIFQKLQFLVWQPYWRWQEWNQRSKMLGSS